MKRGMRIIIQVQLSVRSQIRNHGEVDSRVLTGLLSLSQRESWGATLKDVRRGEELAIAHPLAKLRPFIDDTGVMRVGGRIRCSGEASEADKFPVLLHVEHHGCRALIRVAHEEVGHGGRSDTLHQLRCLGVWIPRVKKVVDSLIHRCVKCRRISGK